MAQRSAINYGLSGVVIGESSICEIDGKNGRLFYRGVPIQELVELPFEDVAYLLIHGHLPSEAESLGFKKHMAAKRFLPDTVQEILRDCINLEPLSALQTALSTMDLADPDCSEDLVCSFPSIITHYHAYRQGKEPLEPDPSLNHATDFLRRLSGSMPCAEMAHAINTDFILHAEHGACASSLAVRTATSAGSSLQAALLAGLSCLSGSRHGGAVNDIGKLLDRLKSPAAAIEFVSNENDLHKRPIPGFGHRIYKVEDPRSEIYRALSDRIRKPNLSPVVDIANALVDSMKPMTRFGVAPNDDLAAAVIYKLLGVPTDLNLSIFAASRVVGWIAHFNEARNQQPMPIPRLRFIDNDMSRVDRY